ncbi:MAG TPA: LytTR family DNA-binding domain-containing protein [Puia sp.]|jgi:two-component system LytT family response regulator|nr:LytTR family DNA-binding domain-containing protein [Puia sp.]
MKISCHIIEDEPMASSLLELYVKKLPVLELVAVNSNPLRALESLKTKPVDLLLLDIRMPEMTGLSLLKVLQKKPLVIITTAYSEFALESYELDVVDYLKKPITFERFLKAVDKVEQRLQPLEAAKEKLGGTDYIFIKEGTRFVKVMIGEILFIEGLKNYVALHTIHQKIISLQRLKSLEDQLPADKFIRVHNSYIVSKSAISSVKENEVYLGGTKIPIGETYFKTFMDFIDGLHLH